MTLAIVLDPELAAKIAGRSKKDTRALLEPVPLADGTFMVPVSVLDDPAHAEVHRILADAPRVEVSKLPRYEEGETPEPVAALSRAMSEIVSAKSERSMSSKVSAEGE